MAYLRINHSSEERKCPVYNFLIPKIKKKKKKSYFLILNLSLTNLNMFHLLTPTSPIPKTMCSAQKHTVDMVG